MPSPNSRRDCQTWRYRDFVQGMTEPFTDNSPDHVSGTYANLIEAAQRIVADEGLVRLSLRNLAEEAGVSTATVTHHLGAKNEIVPKLIGAAMDEDAAFFAPWRELSSQLTVRSGVLAARAYSDWFDAARGRMVLLGEILQSRDPDPVAIAALREWIALHETAWNEIGGANRGYVISRMLVDEATFSGALGASTGYVLLRDLGFARLFRRDVAQAFRPVRDVLAPSLSLVASPPELDGVRSRIAEAAPIIVAEEGAGRLNHRHVGERAGVAASSVVYHFGGRDELLLAALTAVLSRFRHWVQGAAAASADGGFDEPAEVLRITERLVRATHAIGLGAMRHNSLLPHAADMRRRRGENVRADHIAGLGEAGRPHADPLFCQVLSVASFGARMLAMALGEDQEAAYARVASDLTRLV